jgi:DNA-binding winged helix-turn-helix (wHTH) protein/tetratricopeptide (TPR) repeat protein
MTSPSHKGVCEVYRFDTFEVRVKDELLLRDGKVVPIQRLPFRMLVLLLERAGKLVSREELRKQLWGEETFLEFDNNLHVAAGKLREALGPTADGKSFVLTEPRRGYRFVAAVTPIYPAEPTPSAALEDRSVDSEIKVESTRLPRTRRHRFRVMSYCALGATVCAAMGVLALHIRNRPIVSRDQRVGLGGFANHTGNPALDGLLPGILRVKLRQSPYLRFIDDEKFGARVQRPDTASLAVQLAACKALDGSVLLTGEILNGPHGYRVELSEWRCGTGALLTVVRGNADKELDLLQALDATTETLRIRMGEPADVVRKFDAPLAQVTTNSLAALKAFGVADQELVQGDQIGAISNYRLAIDLDAKFVLAYARLGMIYSNEIDPTLASKFLSEAFLLREGTTDRERLSIAANYYSRVTGESQHAIDAYELWRHLYIYDVTPNTDLAIEFLEVGQPDKAIEPARTAVRLDPHDAYAITNLALAYLATGDFQNLNSLCTEAARPRSVTPLFHSTCYQAAFAQNDAEGMKREMQLSSGNSAEILLLNQASRIATVRGNRPEAERLFHLANQKAIDEDGSGLSASFQSERAQQLAELGDAMPARNAAELAMHLSPNDPATLALAAIVYARLGDHDRAMTLATAASQAAPTNTLVNAALLPTAKGATALARGDAKDALKALETARPFDLNAALPFASAYYRGLAYELDHQWEAAAKEFTFVGDHRFVAPNSLYAVLSELELGHVLATSHHPSEAAAIFEHLDDLWKNASPDFAPRKTLNLYSKAAPSKHP